MRLRRVQQNMEEEKKDQVAQQQRWMMQMDGVISIDNEEIKEPLIETSPNIPTPPASVDWDPEVVFQAAQIAPIVDRMGRMLVDFAPHLNNLVKMHHQRLRENATGNNIVSTDILRNPSRQLPLPVPSDPQGNSHFRRLMNNQQPQPLQQPAPT